MMTYDEVLEEIYALPVGALISDHAADTIKSWYHENIWQNIFCATYLMASSYEKLCLDHLRDYCIRRHQEALV